MKNNQNINFQLRDGESILHAWSQDFEGIPTVGDVMKIEATDNSDLEGYGDEATVLLVEEDTTGSGHTIILEAVPRGDPAARPVVVMNRDYIPGRLRAEIESFLRKRFEVPAFEWIHSDLPQPIIDVYANPKPPIDELREITDELRDLLLKDSPLAVVD